MLTAFSEMENFREFPETLSSSLYLTCQNEIQDYMGLAIKLTDFEDYWQDMLFLQSFRYTTEMHLFRYVNAFSMCVKKAANDGRSKIIEDEFYESMIKLVKIPKRVNLDFSSYAIQKNSLASEEFVYFDKTFYVGLKFDYHAMAQEYTLDRIITPAPEKNDNEIAMEINSILDTKFSTYNPEYIEYEDSQRKKYWYGSINDLWRLNQKYTEIYRKVGISQKSIEERIEAEYQFMRISDNYLPEIRNMELTTGSSKIQTFSKVFTLFLLLTHF